MKNKILAAILDHIIDTAEDGECEDIMKFGKRSETAEDEEDDELVSPVAEDDEEDDEDSRKVKGFLAALRGK